MLCNPHSKILIPSAVYSLVGCDHLTLGNMSHWIRFCHAHSVKDLRKCFPSRMARKQQIIKFAEDFHLHVYGSNKFSLHFLCGFEKSSMPCVSSPENLSIAVSYIRSLRMFLNTLLSSLGALLKFSIQSVIVLTVPPIAITRVLVSMEVDVRYGSATIPRSKTALQPVSQGLISLSALLDVISSL